MDTQTRTVKDKHVLVTGGAGFIGSHLVDVLLTQQAGRVTVLDSFFLGKEENLHHAQQTRSDLQVLHVDVADDRAVRAALDTLPPVDVVFDLAVIPLPTSLELPRWCFDTNVRITSTLCELLREGRFETLVHFSSSEAYGSARTIPMGEDHPLEPLTPYAASKAAGDHLVRTYAATFGVDAVVVRPFNNYGPRQNEKQYAGIIPTVLRSALEHREFTVFGDGEQTRDYTYVTDTVHAALALYGCPAARGMVVNVGSGSEISVNELIRQIGLQLDYPIAVRYAAARPGDVRRHLADTHLLTELVGFRPSVSLSEGLANTIEFYRRQFTSTAAR